MLAGETAPTDSTSPSVVQEEGAETVAGRETVQQTGGVGHVVMVQLAVNPASVCQDVLHSPSFIITISEVVIVVIIVVVVVTGGSSSRARSCSSR